MPSVFVTRAALANVPFNEDFNGADNYPTGPIVTNGVTWALGGGGANYGRSGGALFFDGHDNNSSGLSASTVTVNTGAADGTLTATLARNTSLTYGTGLAWRRSSAGAYWFIETRAGGVSGMGAVRHCASFAVSATVYLSLGALPDLATLSVVLAGSLMTFFVNGTNVGTVTDGLDVTATAHGMASDRGGGFGSVDTFSWV
jgi:hypothetical protein